MSQSEPDTAFQDWHLPPPPGLPRPKWRDLFRFTCEELFPRARFIGVPAVVGAGIYLAVADYVAPGMQPLWHLGIVFASLAALALIISLVAAWSKWRDTDIFEGFWRTDAEFRKWLKESVPPMLVELKADAWAGMRADATRPAPAFDYDARILKAEPYGNFRWVLSARSTDSPWLHKGRRNEYFTSAWAVLKDLGSLAEAAAELRRHAQAPSLQHVNRLRNLARFAQSSSPIAACLRELVHAAEERLKAVDQLALDNLKKLVMEAALTVDLEQRRKQEIEEKRAMAEKEAAAAAHLKAQSSLLNEMEAFEALLRENVAGYRSLLDTIRALPAPAHDGMANDAAAWLAEVSQLRTRLVALKRDASDATESSALGKVKQEYHSLKEADRRNYWDLVQIQGVRVPFTQPDLHDIYYGKRAATLAFLAHLNGYAERTELARSLWRFVDRDGSVCLYYYGRDGYRSPRWQAILCRVSFLDSGRGLKIRTNLHIPFGLDDDPIPYEGQLIQGGIAPNKMSKVIVTSQRIKKRIERDAQRDENLQILLGKELHRLLKGKTDFDEQIDEQEDTARRHSGWDARNGMTSKEPYRDASFDQRSGFDDAHQRRLKDLQGSRNEAQEQDELSAELSLQATGSNAHEVVEETEVLESTVAWSINWDAEQLLGRWTSFGPSADMLECIRNIVTSAIIPLEQAARPSRGAIAGADLEENFWREARKLALLQRDFVGWPFSATCAVGYDGRPQAIPLTQDSPSSETSGLQLQFPKRPVPRLPGPEAARDRES